MPMLKFWRRMMSRLIDLRLALPFAASLVASTLAVQAAEVGVCDEADLRAALSEGGTVTFLCSNTITLTNTITITNDVTVDGTGRTVSISGGGNVRIFTVNTGVNLTLKSLTLTAGKHAGENETNGVAAGNGGGGAIFNDGGHFTAMDCIFSAHAAIGGDGAGGVVQLNGRGGSGGGGGFAGGGAIYNFGGTVALTNCVFTNNTATAGGGGNGADGASGGSNDGGRGGDGGTAAGGAIFNAAPGVINAYDCTFADNSASGAAAGTGGNGAGLGSNGSNGVPGTGDSGAIYNDGGTVIVTFSTFSDNTATGGDGAEGKAGAGDRNGTGGTSGAGASGGAILNNGGTVTATNCTFYANIATGGNGGAGGAGGASGFGGNGGDGGAGGDATGGGFYNAGSATGLVVNCTFASNNANGGTGGDGGAAGTAANRAGRVGLPGAINGGGIANGTGSLIIANALLSGNLSGGNGIGAITDGGCNLSDDTSFPLNASGSYTNVRPQLGILGDNGGKTRTVPIISSNSPAINGGNDAVCPPTDQRHSARSGRCDIGAFEYTGVTPVPVLSIRLQSSEVVLSWSTNSFGYKPQATTNLFPAVWSDLSNAPAASGNQQVVTNALDTTNRFYRLIRP